MLKKYKNMKFEFHIIFPPKNYFLFFFCFNNFESVWAVAILYQSYHCNKPTKFISRFADQVHFWPHNTRILSYNLPILKLSAKTMVLYTYLDSTSLKKTRISYKKTHKNTVTVINTFFNKNHKFLFPCALCKSLKM